MIRALLALCLGLGAAVAGPAAGEPPRLASKQVLVAPNVLLAGLLELDGLARLDAAQTLVVDLRTEDEGTAAWGAALAARGFRYRNIPVSGAAVTEPQLDVLQRMRAEAEAADQTLIVHCRSGNRAGLLWGALLVRDGLTADAALDRVGEVLTRPGMRSALDDYAAAVSRGEDAAGGTGPPPP